MNTKLPRTFSQKPSKQERTIGYRILFLLLCGFSLLICAFLPSWVKASGPATELPVSLRSARQANYSADNHYPRVPEISLGIISDALRDQGLGEEEIRVRISAIDSLLQTPVVLATGSYTQLPPPITASTPQPRPTTSITEYAAPTPNTPVSISPTPYLVITNPTDIPENVPLSSASIDLTSSVANYIDRDSSGSITLSDDVRYKFVVHNNGDTSLFNIQINDLSFGSPITCPATGLAAGASMTCTADSLHTVSLSEANAGHIDFKATVTSTYAGKTYTKTATLITAVAQNPSIQIVKNLASFDDNDSSGSITAGDYLWYRFTVTNSGNVTLSNISVTDLTFAIPVNCPVSLLAPSSATNCLAGTGHIITPNEANARLVSNTAKASGMHNGTLYSAQDTLITAVEDIYAVISGQVREDLDGNGVLTDPDPGLANVRIELSDYICTIGVNCRFTLTDSNGMFSFTGVVNGSYQLIEIDPPGYNSTADSDGPNDNRINVVIENGQDSSSHVFLDTIDPAVFPPPDPVTGFVQSTNPDNGATNVAMDTVYIIHFNQPMMTTGGSSVLRTDKYLLKNETNPGIVPIINNITYDPLTYTVTLTIDTGNSNWTKSANYSLTIQAVKNAVGVSQNPVTRTFTTTD